MDLPVLIILPIGQIIQDRSVWCIRLWCTYVLYPTSYKDLTYFILGKMRRCRPNALRFPPWSLNLISTNNHSNTYIHPCIIQPELRLCMKVYWMDRYVENSSGCKPRSLVGNQISNPDPPTYFMRVTIYIYSLMDPSMMYSRVYIRNLSMRIWFFYQST